MNRRGMLKALLTLELTAMVVIITMAVNSLSKYNNAKVLYEDYKNQNSVEGIECKDSAAFELSNDSEKFNSIWDNIDVRVRYWITIDGTAINYPVMQGEDNQYYLTHAFDESECISGSIFLDSRCYDSDRFMLIYGHNMKDVSMFHELKNYQNDNFALEHNTICIANRYGTVEEYSVIACLIVDADSDFISYKKLSGGLTTILAKVPKYNVLTIPQPVISDIDKILILSTCIGGQEPNKRCVVYAVRK